MWFSSGLYLLYCLCLECLWGPQSQEWLFYWKISGHIHDNNHFCYFRYKYIVFPVRFSSSGNQRPCLICYFNTYKCKVYFYSEVFNWYIYFTFFHQEIFLLLIIWLKRKLGERTLAEWKGLFLVKDLKYGLTLECTQDVYELSFSF